jgi:phosphoglycolate phosphatase
MIARPTGTKRLVAFDLDGTLVDSIGDIASSVNLALVERYGAAGSLSTEAIKSFVGAGARYLIERCLGALKRPADETTPVFERFLAIYRGRLVETTRLYPGMADAIDEIGKHAQLAVLTNKPGDMSRAIVEVLGLSDRFMGVIGGDDLKTRKPDPQGLLELAGRAGVRPEETFMVGDSGIDIVTGRNAGAVAIGVLWGYDREGVEREAPDSVAQTPRDLMDVLMSASPRSDASKP